MPQPVLIVARENERISIRGDLTLQSYPKLMAAVHHATRDGLTRLTLDFSACTSVRAGAAVAVCCQVIALRSKGTEILAQLPDLPKLRTLFRNSNWAYLLDPTNHSQSSFQGYKHVPATQFSSSTEQQAAVNAIVDVLLGAMTGIDRSDYAAMEWALNEITDNVLTHARTEAGGLVQVTTFEMTRRRVEFVVCDAGATIPATLREGHREITSDTQALERAIREGITRDKSLGQGNGLFGTFQVCRISKGAFHIHSRYANLSYDENRGLHIKTEQIPYNGTLVVATVDCSRPGVLQDALKFEGQKYLPTDRIEMKYEAGAPEAFSFMLAEETSSFGSRPAGEPVRNKLANLAAMCSGNRRVVLDFKDVPLVSSSFADEAFGKLFLQMGAIRFMQTFEFHNISDTVRSLIDKAIAQRATGA